jgi:hypothetical protein
MDHAAAHERIADLALESDGLERLSDSTSEADRDLLDHLRACSDCQAEVEASRKVRDNLRAALAAVPAATAVQPIAAPDALRTAILEAVHADAIGRAAIAGPSAAAPARQPERRGWPRRLALPRWQPTRLAAGLAAVLAIAVLGGLAGSRLQQQFGGPENDGVVGVVATLDRVLAADPHWVVQLRTPSGNAAGSIAWSHRDLVVLSTSLPQPPAGRIYRCWLQAAGRSAPIGVMDFAGSTAYWTGSTQEWASVSLQHGTTFLVTLEPAGGPAPAEPSTPAILQADLGT